MQVWKLLMRMWVNKKQYLFTNIQVLPTKFGAELAHLKFIGLHV